jgi:microcystin-dependent protein
MCHVLQVGFDAGDGVNYFALPEARGHISDNQSSTIIQHLAMRAYHGGGTSIWQGPIQHVAGLKRSCFF